MTTLKLKELVQMKTCRRKWLARWLAACIAVVLGMGMCAGLPVSAATSAELTISQNGIDFIKAREGFSAKCYYDGAQSSIGYGTKCGTKAHASGLHSITKAAAEVAMRQEIVSSYIPNVRRQTSGLQMNQNQFDALVSFTYNTGGGTSMIKNSPLVKYLRGEMSQAAAASAFESYVVTNSATGKVDSGLKNRRRLEAKLFFSGVNPNPPTWATLSVENNQTVFYSGDTVNFSMASDYATNYTMGVDVNGVRALTQECNGNTSSNIMNDVGEYAVYVTAWNSAGYVDSNVVYFKVIERPWYSSLTPVDLGEQFDSVILAKEPWITFCAFGEDKDYNVELKKEEGITAEMWRFNRQSDGSYVITNFATGRVLDAYGLGTTDFTNVFTDEYNGGDNQKWFIYGKDGGGFVIRAAYTSMVLDIDHAIFESGTNIEMHTKNDSSAQTIALYYENATYGSPKIGDIVSTSTNNSITLNLSDSYYVDKRKVYRSTDKKYWELVNESTDGKGTEITDNNLKSATTYYYKIECSNRYYTETSSIIAVKTNAISLGDLNSDNTLTAADAVLLQRYLLGEDTLTQSQWQTADLNADGTVNGFDLALLRQKLVG